MQAHAAAQESRRLLNVQAQAAAQAQVQPRVQPPVNVAQLPALLASTPHPQQQAGPPAGTIRVTEGGIVSASVSSNSELQRPNDGWKGGGEFLRDQIGPQAPGEPIAAKASAGVNGPTT